MKSLLLFLTALIFLFSGPSWGAGKPATLRGELACMPPDPSATVRNQACQIGLRDDKGIYYELRNLPQDDLVRGKISMGKRYRLKGKLTSPHVLVVSSYSPDSKRAK